MKTEQSTIHTKLYSSLCLYPQTNNADPVRKSIRLLNPPQLLHHHHYLYQNINLTTHSNPCLIDHINNFGKQYGRFKKQHEKLKHFMEKQHE